MGIRVITSVNAMRSGINPWRFASVVLGWVLLLAGLLVTVLMFGLIFVSLALNTSRGTGLGSVLLFASVGAAAVMIGRWLIRGKRRLILFLRRFGFTGSSRALTFAVGTALGRRYE